MAQQTVTGLTAVTAPLANGNPLAVQETPAELAVMSAVWGPLGSKPNASQLSKRALATSVPAPQLLDSKICAVAVQLPEGAPQKQLLLQERVSLSDW